ncbi:putative serine/threonine-protein kinase-like protein CCR3 [Carex littledalei]|uniref:Putative serine/threonine-protein kinase-like protein CCR3 n=1 Tax=Carex littledalei TaxID=544730 RepID=A0A833VBD2_9POAL|nr:putative serine/threonine-protein kinase-like protein CCR3 [Carex littledalei]
MAPSILLLLPALFFSLVLLMVPYRHIMDPTSTTLTISQARPDENGRNRSAVTLSLPRILPGVCVPDETYCSCGVYPDSGDLCGGSGVICMRSDSDTGTTDSCPFSAILEMPHALSKIIWEMLGKWWPVYVIFGIVVAIVGTYGMYICMKWLKLRWCGVPESSASPQQESDLLVPSNPPVPSFPVMENVEEFSFNELKNATFNFSVAFQIGAGSFSVVYRGRLSDGRKVAVKRCNTTGSHREAVFKAEVETLAKARHVNVVSLIGYCTENNERICVFEYMGNKDLVGSIHPRMWQMRTRLCTSWKLRIKVLLDAARGIEYLHRYCEPQIIHRDIKSANILLDEKWVAKISDFGFAVFGPEPGSDRVDVDTVSGTTGYADPDCYGDAPFVSQRTDVYSFGVVMLEIVTGRMAYNAGNNRHLATFAARRIAAGRFREVMDKRLSLPSGQEMEAVEMVARLAQQCVSPGLERPNMSVVVTELESAFARFD